MATSSNQSSNGARVVATTSAAERVAEGVRQGLAQLVAKQAPAEELIELARITGAFGVKGWVKLAPFSADADALQDADEWFIQPGTGKQQAGPKMFSQLLHVKVLQLKPQGDALVAQLEGVNDRDWAQALRGASIALPRSAFPALAEGEFYWVDLIGLVVRNREGLLLGEVSELLSNGPQSVLVVQQSAEGEAKPQERLIPFVDAYVDEVRIQEKLIVVDWQPDY
ncbi:ribosome maturation factor RimM [Lampropedia puyangensis]|uniref:Ribosome maturation factor RimM n=1 Tax=Lampropedia puyangensis TaxID=1330072 RepID=A0A4S8FB21_9BURK|nr:ribosome maturation factor RimM [Lampropedia puyangensis]THU02802.1 ribosome maturation factor RimM [Lampropedia puyangensis]